MRKLLLCLLIGTSFADGVHDLDVFLSKSNNISANFSQIVVSGRKNTVSVGTMEISRPNKFRWEYAREGQLIVSDGEYVYVYDEPLQQVTKSKLGKSLGATPAMLLSGGTDIHKYYNISNKPTTNGIEWVSLSPKNANDNNGFKTVQIGFSKDTHMLSEMVFIDSFDNQSTITFTNVELDKKIPASDFKFVVPDGVDLLKS